MKVSPIIFSTEMVKAILEERKTMTRRIVKLEQPNEYKCAQKDGSGKGFVFWTRNVSAEETARLYPKNEGINCPYGQIGDILWVRETFQYHNQNGVYYRADNNPFDKDFDIAWNPPMFLPKSYARIFLEITNITVEMLNNISESDAKKEGVKSFFNPLFQETRFKDYMDLQSEWRDAKSSFFSLWESINGKKSIKKNNWVWVVEFKRIDKPKNY